MDKTLFWTYVAAAGTLGTAIGAIVGVFIARNQLLQLTKSSGSEAVLRLYELFDEEKRRKNRKKIWQELQSKKPENLTIDEWTIIERTATEMDVVGTMLKYKHIKQDLIFERYAEVIIPLWSAINSHIIFRRNQKGGFGWNNFEWMVEKAIKWSNKKRNTSTYSRFHTA